MQLASVQKALEASEQSSANAAKEANAKQQKVSLTFYYCVPWYPVLQYDEDMARLNLALRQLHDGQQQAKVTHTHTHARMHIHTQW